MRRCASTVVLYVSLLSVVTAAAEDQPSLIKEAYHLQQTGEARAAIALLEPLLRTNDSVLTPSVRGKAWNLLGVSYQDLELYEQARTSFETALKDLKGEPSLRGEYAAALDNLASVESNLGQAREAQILSIKAKNIYVALGDHRDAAVACISLVLISYAGHDYKKARQFMIDAEKESRVATNLNDDDKASMYDAMGVLAKHDRRYEDALIDFQIAIDAWIHSHGRDNTFVGVVYALRAETFRLSANTEDALRDAEEAMAILERSVGHNTRAYLKAEWVYAEEIKAQGDLHRAQLIEDTVERELASLTVRQCETCTVNVDALQ